MEEKLISIIVAVYNIEKYIARCIDSILSQTYSKLEIILVDDGSTDSSGRICDDYKARDGRIRVIHKPNGGLSDARNAGLEIMESKIFINKVKEIIIPSARFCKIAQSRLLSPMSESELN